MLKKRIENVEEFGAAFLVALQKGFGGWRGEALVPFRGEVHRDDSGGIWLGSKFFFFFFNEMRHESHDVLFCLILFFEMVAARPSSQNN